MATRKDLSVEEVVAGVEIYKQPNTKNLFYRRYDANAQVYIWRLTGCDNREDAKKWVMSTWK